MKARTVILLAVVASAAILILYFWQEGFRLRPAPTHWWWYALSAAIWGFSIGQQWEDRTQRRARRRLERAARSMRNHVPTGDRP